MAQRPVLGGGMRGGGVRRGGVGGGEGRGDALASAAVGTASRPAHTSNAAAAAGIRNLIDSTAFHRVRPRPFTPGLASLVPGFGKSGDIMAPGRSPAQPRKHPESPRTSTRPVGAREPVLSGSAPARDAGRPAVSGRGRGARRDPR